MDPAFITEITEAANQRLADLPALSSEQREMIAPTFVAWAVQTAGLMLTAPELDAKFLCNTQTDWIESRVADYRERTGSHAHTG